MFVISLSVMYKIILRFRFYYETVGKKDEEKFSEVWYHLDIVLFIL